MPDQQPPDIRTQAYLWAARVHSGRCGDEDLRALAEWLAQDERHRGEYQEACATWEEVESFRSGIAPEMRAARAYRTRRRVSWFPVAAAAMALLVLAAGIWQSGERHAGDLHRTAKGELREISLADGSSLVINTDTEVTVEYSKRARHVRLTRGEVLVTVAGSDDRPFEVITRGGSIRDIGTRFGVYHDASGTSVTVVEGVVVVTTAAADFPRRLVAGERLSFSLAGEAGAAEQVDAEALTAWSEGRLVFKNKPLEDVIKDFSRYHSATIVIGDPGLKRLRVSGTFLVEDLDSLLAGIESMLPVDVLRKGDAVTLVSRKD